MSETALEAPPAEQLDEFGDPVPTDPQTADAAPPGQEPPAPPAEPAAEPPPWAERFQSVDEMWETFQNVDTLRGRQANELGQLRQQIAAQPAPAAAQPAQMIGELTLEQFSQWKDEEPEEAAFYFAEVRAQEAEARANARIDQELAPLRQNAYQAGAKSAIDLLKQEFGDETVLRHQQALGERIEADAAYFIDESTLHARMSDFVRAREYERLTSPQRQRATDGTYLPGPAVLPAPPVHVEGGSTPAPSGAVAPEVDSVIAEMDAIGPGRDAFGRLGPG